MGRRLRCQCRRRSLQTRPGVLRCRVPPRYGPTVGHGTQPYALFGAQGISAVQFQRQRDLRIRAMREGIVSPGCKRFVGRCRSVFAVVPMQVGSWRAPFRFTDDWRQATQERRHEDYLPIIHLVFANLKTSHRHPSLTISIFISMSSRSALTGASTHSGSLVPRCQRTVATRPDRQGSFFNTNQVCRHHARNPGPGTGFRNSLWRHAIDQTGRGRGDRRDGPGKRTPPGPLSDRRRRLQERGAQGPRGSTSRASPMQSASSRSAPPFASRTTATPTAITWPIPTRPATCCGASFIRCRETSPTTWQ